MELYGYWQVLADRKKGPAGNQVEKGAGQSGTGVRGGGRPKDFFSIKNTLALEAALAVPTFIRKGIIIKI